MSKLARVSSKGQLVIPARIRKKLKITRTVLLREENGRIILEPSRYLWRNLLEMEEKRAGQAAVENLDR